MKQGWAWRTAVAVWIFPITRLWPSVLNWRFNSHAWGLLMTAVLRKGPGVGPADINSKHSWLSRSQLQQVNFLHTLKEKKKKPTKCPKDKMHSISNYYRKNDKMATNITTNTIPVRMAIHTSLQAINVGESQQVREPPYTVGGNAHWQQSLEKTASACQKLKF